MKKQRTIMKYFSIVMTFILFLSMTLPATTQAADTPNPASDFDYEEADGKITITNYKGTSTDVVIPATIDGKPVTVIGDEAFSSNYLTSVDIPASVTTIGGGAFYNNQLTNVEIPAGVTTIGVSAFAYNQLTSVDIPASVTTIGDGAFADNQLTSVTFNNTNTTIGANAFSQNYTGFPGWYTDAALTSEWTTHSSVPASKKLYAKLELKVTYDGNGSTDGTVPTDATSYTSGDTVIVAAPGTLAKTGFTFAGWNTQADGKGTAYAAGATFNVSANTTLYAQWTEDTPPPSTTYTVTYDKNGADVTGDVPIDVTSYTSGGTVTVKGSGTLAKPGFTFAGWNTEADGTGTAYAAGATFNVSADTTLYAQWKSSIEGNGIITTIAGTGIAGFNEENQAIKAQLRTPKGVAVDSEGNVYIADTHSSLIRKVDRDGNIATVAGTGTPVLSGPTGVAVDNEGNVYIADVGNHLIRKVDRDGNITTVAGTGVDGFNEENEANKAQLNTPYGVAVDNERNVYIADTYNSLIRKVDRDGNITTVAGTGTAGFNEENEANKAQLNYPSGVAVDSTGNVYIADTYNHLIRKVDRDGNITTVAGTGAYGFNEENQANKAQSNYPQGVAVDSEGNVYIADNGNNRIRKIDRDGNITTVAGTGTAGFNEDNIIATTAHLNYPNGVAVDSTGNVYIADTSNHRIRKVTYSSNSPTTYTVTFNSNGGTTIDSATVTADTAVAEPVHPTKAGYKFIGWYYIEPIQETEVEFDFATPITADITLYAKWESDTPPPTTYTVTFNTLGGTSVSPQTVTKDGAAVTPNTPTKTGFTFKGWFSDETLQTPYNFSTNVTADIVLYAKWESNNNNNGGGGGSNTTPPVNNTNVDVIVNGKTESIGQAQTSTVGNQTQLTLTVDQAKLQEKLDKEGNNATVIIPVTDTNADVIVGQLNGQMVKNLEDKQATVVVQTPTASYTLSAGQINIDAISQQIGSNVDLKDIKINIEITKPADETVKVVEDAAQQGNFVLQVPPVEFKVTYTSGDKSGEVSRFNAYVERTIAIPDGVDPSKITTGIVVDPVDGTTYHVPTKVIEKDGKYYAVINSLTNSLYAVVWHPLQFADVANHWAKDAINNLGSRMVVNGVSEGTFAPNQDITRAQFAAIMVRGLGLKPGVGANRFGDVAKDSWYADYISTATEYNLITGYTNGNFGPNDKITRQQAFAIIARAMALTDLNTDLSNTEVTKVMSTFKDTNKIATYAKPYVALAVQKGIVNGRSNQTIAPGDNITRAEVATIVERLLKKSDLINK